MIRIPTSGHLVGFAAAVLAGLAVPGAKAEMAFNDYDPAVHNRFDTPGFIGAAFDFSGVAFSGGPWATLISSQRFISANHSHPGVGSDVVFFETNSSSGTSHVRQVIGGQRIENTDLWIGTLSAPLPSSIAVYEIAAPAIPDVSSGLGAYANLEIFTVGETGDVFTVGRNAYDISDATPPINGTFDAVGFVEDLSGDFNFMGADETFLGGGDSGAPSFIDDGGVLKLVGIHSYIGPGFRTSDFFTVFDFMTPEASINNTTTRNLSVDNFVPNYQSEINAALLQPIPEPGSVALLLAAAGVAGCLMRRRSKMPAALDR